MSSCMNNQIDSGWVLGINVALLHALKQLLIHCVDAVLWPRTSWTICWHTSTWEGVCPFCSLQTKQICPMPLHPWSWPRLVQVV